MMADDRWVCYPLTVVQLVSIHGKNSSFPNTVVLGKLCEKTEAGQGMSTTILLDDRQMVMFCFIQLLQTPWAYLLLEMGLYMFASKYTARKASSANLQGVCNISQFIWPGRKCLELQLSQTLHCHMQLIRNHGPSPSFVRTQQQSCSHTSPDCSQVSSTPCKPKEVSRPEPLRPVNTVSTFWSLVVIPNSSTAASLAHKLLRIQLQHCI